MSYGSQIIRPNDIIDIIKAIGRIIYNVMSIVLLVCGLVFMFKFASGHELNHGIWAVLCFMGTDAKRK